MQKSKTIPGVKEWVSAESGPFRCWWDVKALLSWLIIAEFLRVGIVFLFSSKDFKIYDIAKPKIIAIAITLIILPIAKLCITLLGTNDSKIDSICSNNVLCSRAELISVLSESIRLKCWYLVRFESFSIHCKDPEDNTESLPYDLGHNNSIFTPPKERFF